MEQWDTWLIKLVSNNSQWVFSGVGVFVLGLLGRWIWRRRHGHKGTKQITASEGSIAAQNITPTAHSGGTAMVIGRDFTQVIPTEPSLTKAELTIKFRTARNIVGIFTICNTGRAAAKAVVFRPKLGSNDAFLSMDRYFTEDLRGIKIPELHPNTTFDIEVSFTGGPRTMNTFYSWENPDGSQEERNQLVSPSSTY